VKILVYFEWTLSFLTFIITPLDIYESNVNENLGIKKFTSVWWPTCYWIISVLGWIVNPLVSTFSWSGYFTFKDKLMHSVKRNLIYYAILAGICIGGLLIIYYFLSAKNS